MTEQNNARASRDFEEDLLRDPHILLGYMSSSKGTTHKVAPLKTLFNHASKPIPKDLQETRSENYTLPRGELASLVYASAKNNGYGLIKRTSMWLKTRLS